MLEQLSPELVVAGYCQGVFPMADPDEENAVFWYRPDPRAILPLDKLRVSKNLEKTVRRRRFDVTLDTSFHAVIRACADRSSTWISDELAGVYEELHLRGLAHSVETWLEGALVGGLYGVALGGAFFGESMFHRETDASKVALVHLVRHLRERSFVLLDVQYQTPHLAQFGVVEIPAHTYEQRLQRALALNVSW